MPDSFDSIAVFPSNGHKKAVHSPASDRTAASSALAPRPVCRAMSDRLWFATKRLDRHFLNGYQPIAQTCSVIFVVRIPSLVTQLSLVRCSKVNYSV